MMGKRNEKPEKSEIENVLTTQKHLQLRLITEEFCSSSKGNYGTLWLALLIAD